MTHRILRINVFKFPSRTWFRWECDCGRWGKDVDSLTVAKADSARHRLTGEWAGLTRG